MDKAKVAKFAVKAALGLTVSAAIGSMIKLEKSIGTHIDELFNKSDSTNV
jgi:hypothetical protein